MANFSIGKLLMLVKDVSPLVVCIFTFVTLLFAYKTLFKVHRNNILPYAFSLVTTTLMYFAFIYVFKLSRYDYFLDGINLLGKYFKSFGSYLFIIFISASNLFKCVNLSFLSIWEISRCLLTYLNDIDVSTCAYIAFHYSYRFKKQFKIFKEDFFKVDYNPVSFAFKANQINCVYTC